VFALLLTAALWPLTLGVLGAVALVGAFLIVVGYFFEDDWYFKGFLALGLVGAYLWFRGSFEHLDWRLAGLYAGGYLASGIVWSLYKWVIFVSDLKKHIQEYMQQKFQVTRNKPNAHEFTRDFDKTQLTYVKWAELTKEEKGSKLQNHLSTTKYAEFLNVERVKEDLHVTPTLSTWTNKAKIVSWIVYWPLSVASYVFGRLLKDLIDFVIENLKGVYNLIAASIMKGLEI
jgi:hypothetical protein